MKRRKLLVGAAATAVGAAAAGTLWFRESGESAESSQPITPAGKRGPKQRARATRTVRPISSGPNVLMISIDDMKPWIGPHGFAAAHTPALDAFSRQSVLFRKAYCAAPACSPSRAAVFTGLAPHQSGCYRNKDNWRDLAGDTTVFPRLLREAGYFTAGFGKLFHTAAHDDPKSWDEREFLRLLRLPGAPLEVPESIWRKSGSRFDWQSLDMPVEEMDDHKQVNRSIAAMKKSRDRPFFVACGIFRPHLPWYVPRRFFDLHPLDSIPLPEVIEGDLDDVPKRGRELAKRGNEHHVLVSEGLWRPAVQAYMASISYADYEVGRLLAETPRDTVIVLWSDHGWHLGPKNHWHKYTLWEEASQTVFAIASPDAAAGEQCARTVSLNDIYPTICEVAGVSPRHKLAGRSVMPLVRDPSAPWDRPALTTYGPDNHALRNERYRYIRYDDGGEELYDHKIDPNEWNNLASTAEAAPIIKTLAPLLPPPSGTKRKRRNPGERRKKGERSYFDLPGGGRRALLPS